VYPPIKEGMRHFLVGLPYSVFRTALVNQMAGFDMPLAQWAVNCKSCKKAFSHSEIHEPQRAIDYLWPLKPQIPTGGQELECPHCKSKATYRQTDLWYLAANL
jgi:hypothetical protein